MTAQTDILALYDEAIANVELWRNKRPLTKATPNEIHLYNVFTEAKRQLSGHLACIEDSLGVYMKRDKNAPR
jgi:hypothetical protein